MGKNRERVPEEIKDRADVFGIVKLISKNRKFFSLKGYSPPSKDISAFCFDSIFI